MHIIVINGYPESGKDLFVQYCGEIIGRAFVKNLSTIDFVKQIAAECGWNGVKTPESREFLSNLKDLLTDWDDVPFKKVEKEIRLFTDELSNFGLEDRGWIFIHCREPKEIQKFCTRLGAQTVFINRESSKRAAQSNHADAEVENFCYDFYIDNNKDTTHLYYMARDFIYNLIDLENRVILKEKLKGKEEENE